MQHQARLGLIGGGYWGKNLARNFHALGVLAGLCDADEEHLRSYAEQYPQARLVADWHRLVADPELDMVAVATPPHTHAEIIEAALRAGKDVFVEKPVCHTLAEMRRLNAFAAEGERVIMAGHLLQYHAVLAALRERVQAGELGDILHVEARRLNIGKIYTERNVMWNFGPHDLSLVLAMVGDRLPEEVSCQGHCMLAGDVADMTTLTLRFADGATAQVQNSWISPIKEARLLVYGSKGSAVFDDVRPWEQKLEWFEGYTGVVDARKSRGMLAEPRFVEVPPGEPLLAECRHFVDCCRDRCEPITSGGEAERVITVLDAAQRSLEGGGSAVAIASL